MHGPVFGNFAIRHNMLERINCFPEIFNINANVPPKVMKVVLDTRHSIVHLIIR